MRGQAKGSRRGTLIWAGPNVPTSYRPLAVPVLADAGDCDARSACRKWRAGESTPAHEYRSPRLVATRVGAADLSDISRACGKAWPSNRINAEGNRREGAYEVNLQNMADAVSGASVPIQIVEMAPSPGDEGEGDAHLVGGRGDVRSRAPGWIRRGPCFGERRAEHLQAWCAK